MTYKFYTSDGVCSLEILPNYQSGTMCVECIGEDMLPMFSIEMDHEDIEDLKKAINAIQFKLNNSSVDFDGTT